MNTAERNALYAKARGAALSRFAEAEERVARGLPAEREKKPR